MHFLLYNDKVNAVEVASCNSYHVPLISLGSYSDGYPPLVAKMYPKNFSFYNFYSL